MVINLILLDLYYYGGVSDIRYHSPQIDVALSVNERHCLAETAHLEQFCYYDNCRPINTLVSLI